MQGVGTDAVALLAKGILLGLGAAVPIGPVNVQIARLALRHGFVPAFCLGCGAVTVDVAYAVLATVGVGRVVQDASIQVALRLAGAAFLTWLGVLCLHSEREAWRRDPIAGGNDVGPTRTAARAYAAGLLMTLLNPMTLAFWFVAVPALAGPAGENEGRNLPWICSGVFAGTVSWVVAFAGVLAGAGRFRRNWWLAAADAAGGAAMLVFAAVALLSSVRPFL